MNEIHTIYYLTVAQLNIYRTTVKKKCIRPYKFYMYGLKAAVN